MFQKQKNHKAFSKPFWKLLGASVLSLGLVYGGIIWASELIFKEAQECSGANRINCIKLGQKDAKDSLGEIKDVRLTVPLPAAIIGGTVAKELKFTNTTTDRQYYIPLKTEVELKSFLDANNYLPTRHCEEERRGNLIII